MKTKNPVFWNESLTYVIGILNYLLSQVSQNLFSKSDFTQNILQSVKLR